MAYTPYDWQQTLQQKAEYVESRLREGSPVAAASCADGLLALSIRRGNQRKIFELYDRLAFSGLGHQSDLEAVRQLALDFAHSEGFQRSPDDVTIQRVVALAVSPAVKRTWGDLFRAPLVLRGLFAQRGPRPEDDLYYTLNYDGEFTVHAQCACAAGSGQAATLMMRVLRTIRQTAALKEALPLAIKACAIGRWAIKHESASAEAHGHKDAPARNATQLPPEREWKAWLTRELESAQIEATIIERGTQRTRPFRLIDRSEIDSALPRSD